MSRCLNSHYPQPVLWLNVISRFHSFPTTTFNMHLRERQSVIFTIALTVVAGVGRHQTCTPSKRARLLEHPLQSPCKPLPDPVGPQVPVGAFSKTSQFLESLARHIELTFNPTTDREAISMPPVSRKESQFYSMEIPSISLRHYLQRLERYAGCSHATFVAMIELLDRVAKRNKFLIPNSFNVHRLLTASLSIVSKLLDDRRYSNKHYAAVGGVPSAAELFRLETTFLGFIDSNLWITEAVFIDKVHCLETLMNDEPGKCVCSDHVPGNPSAMDFDKPQPEKSGSHDKSRPEIEISDVDSSDQGN